MSRQHRTLALILARLAITAMLVGGVVCLATDVPAQNVDAKADGKNAKTGTQQKPRTEDEDDPKPKAPEAKKDKVRRVEEEEDTRPTKRKVIRVDEEDPPAKAGMPQPEGSRDLVELAKRTKNQVLKQLYRTVAVPHDRVDFRSFGPNATARAPEWVEPLSIFVGDDPKATLRANIELRPMDEQGKPGKAYHRGADTIQQVRHYEQLAVDAVNEFDGVQQRLPDQDSRKLSRKEQLAAEEKVLAAAVRFNESAKATGQRVGEEWEDPVEKPLRTRLLEVLLEQLKLLSEANQWDAAYELTGRLVRAYPDVESQKRIAAPLTNLLDRSFKSGVEAGDGTREALRRLHELQEQFPDGKVLTPLTKGLEAQAQKLFDRAQQLAKETDRLEEARLLTNQAVEIWPTLKGLRQFQFDMMQKHQILRVGVRGLPQFLSPAMATSDSERRGVELIFESLVKLGVDPAGNARFVPGLAESRPQVVSLGRRFLMPRNAYWSDNQPLTANDVRSTLALLKKGLGNGKSPIWGELLDNVTVGSDPYRVLLPLQQGYLDPLSLMTFKVLPQSHNPETEAFARSPVGSGPYKLHKFDSEDGRPYVSFIVNPQYGARPTKLGLPRIHEIRFFAYDPYDPKNEKRPPEFEFQRKTAPLDLLLDLTAEHASALALKAGVARARVRRPGAGSTPNRRVYFLAVNHAKPALASADVRRALAYAIDREKLLDEFFRERVDPSSKPVLGSLHSALNGPYPAASWACNPIKKKSPMRETLDPFDTDLAMALYKQAGERGEVRPAADLTLKYPDDDPALKPAMEAICRQWQEVLGFKVEPVGLSPDQLRKDVEQTQSYALAYYWYDFPDETFWLWPLFAPRLKPNETNYFNYKVDKIQELFQEAIDRRNFEQVKQWTRRIQEVITREMPLIPLWQLDPLAAVSDDLQAPPFDPLLVFTDAAQWKLTPKP